MQAQGSINQTFIQLKLGARDKSFMHMVSFLAKWLFTIKHGLHHPQIHAFIPYFRDSCKNHYPMLFVSLIIKITLSPDYG